MKDIDFDELDRAVSSLMGSVPKDNSVKKNDGDSEVSESEPIPETTTIQVENSTPESTSTPVVSEPITFNTGIEEKRKHGEAGKDDTISKTTDTSQNSVATPSRGRFMDMVRPSTRDARRTFSPATPSRQGVTLQPRNPQFQVTPDSADTMQQPKEVNSPAEESEPSILTLETGEPMEDTTTSISTPEPTETTPDEYAVPLSSPFLADAKVEKRPLGRPIDPNPPVGPPDSQENGSEAKLDTFEEDVEKSVTRNKDAQLPEQPLPAELDSELLNIETSSVGTPQESYATEPAPMPPKQENESSEKPGVTTPFTPSAAETTSPSPDQIRTIASTSIPQQYKVQTATNEETPVGAIYDTQPLIHPAEKKPGWLLIVAILAILILGAAGGAAVYYLGLL